MCAQCALSRVGTKVSGLLIVCVGAHTFHVSSRVKMALESDEYITHDGELDRTVPIGGRLPVISYHWWTQSTFILLRPFRNLSIDMAAMQPSDAATTTCLYGVLRMSPIA